MSGADSTWSPRVGLLGYAAILIAWGPVSSLVAACLIVPAKAQPDTIDALLRLWGPSLVIACGGLWVVLGNRPEEQNALAVAIMLLASFLAAGREHGAIGPSGAPGGTAWQVIGVRIAAWRPRIAGLVCFGYVVVQLLRAPARDESMSPARERLPTVTGILAVAVGVTEATIVHAWSGFAWGPPSIAVKAAHLTGSVGLIVSGGVVILTTSRRRSALRIALGASVLSAVMTVGALIAASWPTGTALLDTAAGRGVVVLVAMAHTQFAASVGAVLLHSFWSARSPP